MSKRGTTAALKDILEAIDRIERYLGGLSEQDFLSNTEKQDAVLRNLEVIGEAVRSIPLDRPTVSGSALTWLRNRSRSSRRIIAW